MRRIRWGAITEGKEILRGAFFEDEDVEAASEVPGDDGAVVVEGAAHWDRANR